MYYNEGQSLVTLGKWDEAAQAALSRREIWKNQGERLLGVAGELAAIDQAARAQQASNADGGWKDSSTTKLGNEVIETLVQATEHGYTHTADLAKDARFAYLHDDPAFVKLLGKQSGDEDTNSGMSPQNPPAD
jgi:hypothetical protein